MKVLMITGGVAIACARFYGDRGANGGDGWMCEKTRSVVCGLKFEFEV